MLKIGDITIVYATWVPLGLAALALWGAWRGWRAERRLWRPPAALLALMALICLGASMAGIPIVMTNAQLQALPSYQWLSVLRMGVYSAGDATPQWFIPSATACAIVGGDVGSQVPAADGGCFKGVFSTAGGEVAEWGAKGDGTTDDTAAIRAAIASGINPILFKGFHTYNLTGTLQIGNGSPSAMNTGPHPVLRGPDMAGVAINFVPFTPPFTVSQPILNWVGSVGASGSPQSVVEINGVLQGWGLQNITIQCPSPGANYIIGLDVISGQYGDNRNLEVLDCQQDIAENVVSARPPGTGGWDIGSLYNSYYRTFVRIKGGASINQYGIWLGSTSTATNADIGFDDFRTLSIEVDCGSGSQYCSGLYLRDVDVSYIYNLHIYDLDPTGASTWEHAVTYDFTHVPAWPAAITISDTDLDARNIEVKGTPYTANPPADGWGGPPFNFFMNQEVGSGQAQPINIPALLVDHIAGPWTPVVAGGTTAGTPTYSTQSGVFRNTGWDVQLDFTLTVTGLGGAVGSVQIKGLPITQNVNQPGLPAPLGGQGTGSSGIPASCAFSQWSGITLDASYTQLTAIVQGNAITVSEAGSGQVIKAISMTNLSTLPAILTGHCSYSR